MIKVLRVSTHPTKSREAVGYQSYMMSKNANLKTTFVAPLISKGDVYVNPENYVRVLSTVLP